MSVLIKGMEMPHNCFLCPLSVMNGERVYCEVTKDEVLRAKIAQDCPIIELPPHGRPVRMGKWIWDDEGCHCSECFYHAYGETGEVLSGHWHFCPNCGTDMRLEEVE